MINFRKFNEPIRKALDEEIFVGHIDKEELSPEVFAFLQQMAEEDPDGMVVYSKSFKFAIEQLREQTPEDEEGENELLSKIIEEIGPTNYENLIEQDLNYIVIHFVNDAKENDIKQEEDQADELEDVIESLKETVERYLCVDPNPDDETHNAVLTLVQGDEDVDAIGFTLTDEMKDKDIIDIAKGNFDNITDDIRVQWF